MECNKEEAIRAKDIAEKKMQNKDFVGARKIAQKAQQLYSELENISQMLTVCDVHCSAEQRVLGTERNWYSILQVEQTADEASIKKQYRKLALLLHPDKNKFAGAEAAFKLIGEAQRVLSDQMQRSMYDMKYKASMNANTTRQPQQQRNRNPHVRKQPGINVPVNIGVSSYPQRPPQPRPTQPVFANDRPTFWTACPFCSMRYQYYRDILNRALHCQSCTKAFIAYDLNVQGVPPGANWGGSAVPQQNQVPKQTNFPSNMGFQGHFGFGATAPKPAAKAPKPSAKTGGTSEVGRRSKTKVEEDGNVNIEDRKEDKEGPKFKAEKSNLSRNKGRKLGEESSEGCDTESSTDSDEYENVYVRGGLSRQENSGTRRSSRQKQQVSYNEDLSDDDFQRPSKRSKGSKSAGAAEDRSEASLKEDTSKTNKHDGSAAFDEDKNVKQNASSLHEESLPNGNVKAEEVRTNRNEAEAMECDMERTEVDANVESNADDKTKPDPEFFEVPDPDFYNFDQDRKEDSFEVDQMWAIYDDVDGMPRFYARIRKVFPSGFKVRLTWLENDPDDEVESDWIEEGLPVACGNFKHGKTENTEDIGMFSHLVLFEKGSRQNTYKIFPRKGETWALFKNWDSKWYSDADNHKEYEFEFVEVLSDYKEGSAICVAYLVKVKGFVSLYMLKAEMKPVNIPSNELLRFSHRVPSYRTTGKERENVPEGYFELDPASVTDVQESVDPEVVKVKAESMDSKINNTCSKPSEETNMPEVSIDPDEKNYQDRGDSGSRNQSPLEPGQGHEKQSQGTVSQTAVKEEDNNKNSNQEKDSCEDDPVPVEKHSDAMDTGVSVDSSPSAPLSPEPLEIPDPEFYIFDADRTEEKFKPGQIWALYCELDGLPKYYGRIDKVDLTPEFQIDITWVEPCSLSKDMIQWFDKDMPICCGVFELGDSQVFTDTTTFSHQSSAKPTNGKNKYEIYPRKGEVWALYKNFNSEWKRTDVVNCEYEMVEVLEANDRMTKVLTLERVDGFKTVFKAKKVGVSPIALEIPRVNLLRFSHRIPAWRIQNEGDGIRKGFWELDPKSLPTSLFR